MTARSEAAAASCECERLAPPHASSRRAIIRKTLACVYKDRGGRAVVIRESECPPSVHFKSSARKFRRRAPSYNEVKVVGSGVIC